MTDNPDRAKEIFLAALKLSPDQWTAYLHEACGAEEALRARIRNLLLAHQEAGSFLEPGAQAAVAPVSRSPDQPGAVIGPYKLLQQIGEGGMGTVFMAEQARPVRRRVALKIIKPGMDSRQVTARFEAERQALAMMDHQNIARVFEAGTTESGRPYFVMELVNGVPITQFCDERKFSPHERLALFVPVCQAIQHAHQHGVIHRDIKPSNILVTMYDDRPVPKVIDFGVAKAVEQPLTDGTLFTQFGMLVGTLEYMSPEQAERYAFGVDTRSDVYSLGVVLYELLTGTTPLEEKRLKQAALDELLRFIREEEAPRPSVRLSSSNELPAIAAARNTEPGRLSRLVRGEVDWIVMKCLEKDRSRRYESASGLARDIERYLADEPVEACPPTTAYRLLKFGRKHRKSLLVTGAFLLLLIVGTIASAWQAVRATLAEREATNNGVLASEHAQEAVRAREEIERQHDALRHALYVSDVNRAYRFWDEGNVARSVEMLERHRPHEGEQDLRGVEWRYLNRLCQRLESGLKFDAQSPTAALAVSPDGRTLATASDIGMVRLWDAATGAPRSMFSVASPWATYAHCSFSSDGATLFSITGDGALRTWDVAAGRERVGSAQKLDLGEYSQLAFAPDSSTVLGLTRDGKLGFWDPQTGRQRATLDAHAADPALSNAYAHKIALAGGGKTVAWAMGGTVLVWDFAAGKLVVKDGKKNPWCSGLALSADGKLLAFHRGGLPHTVHLWDTSTAKQVAELHGFGGNVNVLAFSPDGKLLAAAGEEPLIRVFDTASHAEVAALRGHGGTIVDLVFSPDSHWLYSAGMDGLARRWPARINHDPDVFSADSSLLPIRLEFTPDSRRLFMASFSKAGKFDLETKRWDLDTGRELLSRRHEHVRGVSAGGDVLVFTNKDECAAVWDPQSNRQVARLGVRLQDSRNFRLTRFSPDGRLVIFLRDGQESIEVWETHTGKLRGSIAVAGKVSTAFSPDSQTLAVATVKSAKAGEFGVKLWDTASMKQRTEFPVLAESLRYTPDGRTLVTLSAQAVTLWDTASRRARSVIKLRRRPSSAPASLWAMAFSPDGKILALGDRLLIELWDTARGEHLATLKGHRQEVRLLAFSPDGQTLASADHTDPVVKLWNVATHEELTTLTGPTWVSIIKFAGDGSLAVAYTDDSVHVWRTHPDADKRPPAPAGQ